MTKLLKGFSKGVASGAILLLMISFMSACGQGCATVGGARHQGVVAIRTAHEVLAQLDDFERSQQCGKPGAPQPPACVDAELDKRISGYLAEAYRYDVQMAGLMRAVPSGAPAPMEVLTLIEKIRVLVAHILEALPNSQQRENLKASLTVG